MNSYNNYIACTIMMRSLEDRAKFLVYQEEESCSFPTTTVKTDKTALASAITRLKELVSLDVEDLDLVELTNAVVHENHVPLYVFTCEESDIENKDIMVKNEENHDNFRWVYYNELVTAFDEWKIEGVPQLLKDY